MLQVPQWVGLSKLSTMLCSSLGASVRLFVGAPAALAWQALERAKQAMSDVLDNAIGKECWKLANVAFACMHW